MKNWMIFVGIVVAFGILLGTIVATTYNRAINLEESIANMGSDIQIQEQRRFDLITKLVDTVEANAQYESGTMKDVIKMRQNLANGKLEDVQTLLQATAEQYPQLKATEGYTQLMSELSITENLISEQRKTYTSSIKDYKAFTRSWPNTMFLAWSGYKKVFHASSVARVRRATRNARC